MSGDSLPIDAVGRRLISPVTIRSNEPELADEGEEGGREQQAEAGHADHAEQHGRSEQLAHLGTGARRYRERADAQDEG